MTKYSVDISGLKNKEYSFDFKIDENFFKLFESDLMQNGSLKADIVLSKSETMITVRVKIDGTIELTCDRSLREFDYPISVEEQLYYKFGDRYEEMSDDVFMIPANYAEIDFSQILYDVLALSIPTKIIHPDLQSEEDDDDEEETFVFSTADEEQEIEEEKQENEESDPRWDKLKGLNFNKN
ncbi:MAG: hypothetical protein CMO01_20365 [Thalassobius sp.]|nr:hypothetical protein [Thalassovita sp.]